MSGEAEVEARLSLGGQDWEGKEVLLASLLDNLRRSGKIKSRHFRVSRFAILISSVTCLRL